MWTTSDGRISLIFLCYSYSYMVDTHLYHPDFETNRKYAFLAAIPETPAGSSSSSRRACLVSRRVVGPWNVLIGRIISIKRINENDAIKRKKDRDSIPRPLALLHNSGSALTHCSTAPRTPYKLTLLIVCFFRCTDSDRFDSDLVLRLKRIVRKRTIMKNVDAFITSSR